MAKDSKQAVQEKPKRPVTAYALVRRNGGIQALRVELLISLDLTQAQVVKASFMDRPDYRAVTAAKVERSLAEHTPMWTEDL